MSDRQQIIDIIDSRLRTARLKRRPRRRAWRRFAMTRASGSIHDGSLEPAL